MYLAGMMYLIFQYVSVLYFAFLVGKKNPDLDPDWAVKKINLIVYFTFDYDFILIHTTHFITKIIVICQKADQKMFLLIIARLHHFDKF